MVVVKIISANIPKNFKLSNTYIDKLFKRVGNYKKTTVIKTCIEYFKELPILFVR